MRIKIIHKLILLGLFFITTLPLIANNRGFVDAAEFGFSPNATGVENVKALQKAIDQTGTIIVSQPGVYKVAGTTYIGSNTAIEFGKGVILQKVNEVGLFSHVLLNKGALTRTWDEHISVKGLHISVNGVVKRYNEVFGLRGQLAFFYVKDLKIEGFRCYDIEGVQFSIHVCTFEDLLIDDTIMEGDKDGIHLGRGNRFKISNATFKTLDDALALNAHDYANSNPEVGWIENGVIENCNDLSLDGQPIVGYFCRILAGAWIDWEEGLELQNADAVVSNGRIYRVDALGDDGKIIKGTWKTKTQPTHKEGTVVLDGIKWVMMQDDVQYTAGVRNVVYRDIFLEKPRSSFSIHFDNSSWSRSYYPGATIPQQEQLLFDNVKVLHDGELPFVKVNTPVDVFTITNCSLRNSGILFHGKKGYVPDYGKTFVNFYGNTLNKKGEMTLIENRVEGKEIILKMDNNIEISEDFKAIIKNEGGIISINSDLTGLK
ncbi:hypothetical protein [Arenibacter troitsensis]|uniref:Pectate lyase superfamily protein n=1 Tax=Arenibacter troitsensis TaxID=188872 RepID=A0A1X7IH47_9FLAO|nr:hypothetical protein [Arenibacter troitsensis]SMG14147.1 hypothetical protein SAMN03080602_00848 [Arenibacter troitsensis]